MCYSISEIQKFYVEKLEQLQLPAAPSNLYTPVRYLLDIGGKRIRPTLVLAAFNMYKDDMNGALPMAHAVEFFHNFSLMHDDIMDEASIRRGKQTVHEKYDLNTAILSGDIMLIQSYEFIEQCPQDLQLPIFSLFNKTSKEICEGQQMDMDFEKTETVAISDYLEMITLKTSVLIGASMQYGGVLAGANDQDQKHLYHFGKNIGIAFQVQDDILDVFAESENSGKQKGGDILQKKKTYLYLKSLELLSEQDSLKLKSLYESDENDPDKLIADVLQLFKSAHVKTYAQELKLNYQQLAMSHLDAVSVPESKKKVLREFATSLLNRTS